MVGTKEPQYQRLLDVRDEVGLAPLGLMMNQAWHDDPKRLAFTFSRYKFVAKMLVGAGSVLEIGCGDAFPSRIVAREVGRLSVTDFDPAFISDIEARPAARRDFDRVFVHDMLDGAPPGGPYDGIFSLDVLEHISPDAQDRFMSNLVAALGESGVAIVGMPSLESQSYASEISKAGHVNCQTMPAFKAGMQRYFRNVFMFSMNDEVVHTGYHKMAQYLIALCCGRHSAGS